jgi:site-specific DNA-methyltransferase (adenine-specific)
LDPFCGCGTAVASAQRLNRRWIGIDITHLAITLMKHRLQSAFGDHVAYSVIGEPVTLPDAAALAASDPYQFQWWALGFVGARPVEQKKGADRGIDGRLFFHEQHGMPTKQIIFSVKAGSVNVSQVRDLRGVIEREKAQIGVLISLHEPTRAMRVEAAAAGFYTTGRNESYPRLQLLTIAELLKDRGMAYPAWSANTTYKSAPRVRPQGDQATQQPLLPQDGAAGSAGHQGATGR